jgi:hypothetical protein
MSFLGEPRVPRGNTFIIRDDSDSVGERACAIFANFKKHTKGMSLKKYMKAMLEFQACYADYRNPYYLNDPEGIRISRITIMLSRMIDSEIAVLEGSIQLIEADLDLEKTKDNK